MNKYKCLQCGTTIKSKYLLTGKKCIGCDNILTEIKRTEGVRILPTPKKPPRANTKKIGDDNLKKLIIENIEKDIKELSQVKDKMLYLLNINCSDINDKALQKYIELQSGKEVADYLNDNGHRIPTHSKAGERKYIPNDITDIITSKDIEVNKELKDFAKALYNYHKGKQYFSSIVKLSI